MSAYARLPLGLRFAIPGTVTGLAVAAVITIAFGGNHAIWWWPAGTAAFAFGGFWLGWLLEQEVVGGRADRADELEARGDHLRADAE